MSIAGDQWSSDFKENPRGMSKKEKIITGRLKRKKGTQRKNKKERTGKIWKHRK